MKRLLAAIIFFIIAVYSSAYTIGPGQALNIPDNSTLNLDTCSWYSVTYALRSGTTGSMPFGWQGINEDFTGLSCGANGTQAGRNRWMIQPAWMTGVGNTDQNFILALPTSSNIQLGFSFAMNDTDSTGSDGITFNVKVNGVTRYSLNTNSTVWNDQSLDLTSYAGQNITLTFESDPGPSNNSNFDYGEWSNRVLTLAGGGMFPVKAAIPDIPDANLFPRTQTFGSASPTWPNSPSSTQLSTGLDTDQQGLFNGWSAWLNPAGEHWQLGWGGCLYLLKPDTGYVRSDDPSVGIISETHSSIPGGTRRIVQFAYASRTVTAQVDFYDPVGGVARADISSADPYVVALVFGWPGPVPFSYPRSVPYYTEQLFYYPDEGAFASIILDHKVTHATNFNSFKANYLAKTDGNLNTLNERVYFSISKDILAVMPSPGNAASPYKSVLKDKIFLDDWGGNFSDIKAWAANLFSYGINRVFMIVHDWQNAGYDRQLPDILPAQAAKGGDAGLLDLSNYIRANNGLFGIHENYTDLYTDAPSWDANRVARNPDNSWIPAWFNVVQSYAVAPSSQLYFSGIFSPQVHSRYNTDLSFLDVCSSVNPSFHVDCRSTVLDPASMQQVWNSHPALWQFLRTTHTGPVLGEGGRHWFWSGLLDGVEADAMPGNAQNNGYNLDLFTDFNLAMIHPLQLNHGMGYVERWRPNPDPTDRDFEPMVREDQYRMQELIYGHSGFVSANYQFNIYFPWVEENLIAPVANVYGDDTVTSIRYYDGAGEKLSSAIIAEGAAFDRAHIKYSSWLNMWANNNVSNWSVSSSRGPLDIPQYGWLADGAGTYAYTALKSGVIVDYCETTGTVFANARTYYNDKVHTWLNEPVVSGFIQTGNYKFNIRFKWIMQEGFPAGYAVFDHIVNGSNVIVGQIDDGIPSTPDTWTYNGVTEGAYVSYDMTSAGDGTYYIRTGIYPPPSGDRLVLTGLQDSERRVVMGTLTISGGGTSVVFTPQAFTPSPYTDLRFNNSRAVVNFGKVATDGSVRFEKESGGKWKLIPYPNNMWKFVAINTAQLDASLDPIKVQAYDQTDTLLGTVASTAAGTYGAGWYSFTTNGPEGTAYYIITRDPAAPTYTPSPIATASPSMSMTKTPTFTASATATNTLTATSSATNSASPTQTYTRTYTPTYTSTPVYSPTASPSGTPPTATDTPAITDTVTSTFTSTNTPQNSATMTGTAVNTQSFTPTYSMTFTRTATPSFTETPMPPATQTQTVTQTQTMNPAPAIVWEDKFEVTDALVYPNPHSNANDNLNISIDITRPATQIKARIYTVAFRLVLEEDCGPVNTKQAVVTIPAGRIKGMASGIYYLVIKGTANPGNAVSKPRVLFLMR
jgi:hypothetical protein